MGETSSIINFTSSNSTRYAYTIATMRLSIAAALAASASCAAAFKDTSPFVMFSDSKLPQDLNTAQLQTSSSILASAKAHLSTCPSQIYYILTQPSLLASELSTHAPHLKNAVERGLRARGRREAGWLRILIRPFTHSSKDFPAVQSTPSFCSAHQQPMSLQPKL